MKLIAVIFVLVMSAAMPPAMAAASVGSQGREDNMRVLRVATNPGIEPMEFMRGGQLVGYDIDVAAELARRLDVKVKWVVVKNFDDILAHVMQGVSGCVSGGVSGGGLDLVISAMGIDDERTRNAIAVPYFKSGLTILASTAEAGISTLDSLKGKTIAAVRGSTEHGIIKKMPAVTVVAVDDYDCCIAAVLSGKAAAAVLDVPVALVAAKRDPGKLRVVDHPFEEEWYGIYMARTAPALFQEVRNALKTMRRDGTLDRLNAKWF